ncbi:MAG: transcription elongation factor Spt5 [Thermoprotei archaeon]
MSENSRTKYYAVRTTMGKEQDVALIMENRGLSMVKHGKNPGIYSIIIPPGMRGYVFLEALSLSNVLTLMSNIKYVKTTQPVVVSEEEIDRLVKPKPVIESLSVGDIVEIIRGPFRGMKARVTAINKSKNSVTVSILEAAFAVPIEVPSDYVKPVKSGG